MMSKKIAAGAKGIVLGVKWGKGAFITNLEEARLLAEMMVYIARLTDRKAAALLSDMNQPLGCAVGNALEVIEAVETLCGGGQIETGQPLFTIHANREALASEAQNALFAALSWSDDPVPPLPLFYEVVKSADGLMVPDRNIQA